MGRNGDSVEIARCMRNRQTKQPNRCAIHIAVIHVDRNRREDMEAEADWIERQIERREATVDTALQPVDVVLVQPTLDGKMSMSVGKPFLNVQKRKEKRRGENRDYLSIASMQASVVVPRHAK